MRFILVTPDEMMAARALDGDGIAIGGRLIDAPSSPYVWMWAVPARAQSDPEYERYSTTLAGLPILDIDPAAVFAAAAAAGD